MLGGCDAGVAAQFLYDLRQRLANRVQLTSEGHKRIWKASIMRGSGMNLDYAMLVKLYGENAEAEKCYSPAKCIGYKRTVVIGDPDPDHIPTSFMERQHFNANGLPVL